MDYEVKDFNKDVIETSRVKPVVIDFWAPWCGPCRQLGPVIEKLAGEAAGAWSLVKINTDKHPDLAMQFQIRGIPAVKMVYDGALLGEFTGAQPETAIRSWLDKHLPDAFKGKSSDWQEEVGMALSRGDRSQALSILGQVPDPTDAVMVRMALLMLPREMDAARRLLNGLRERESFLMEEGILATVEHLWAVREGRSEPSHGDSPAHPSVVEAYRSGIEMLFEEEFEQSLLHFLDALQRDRAYDEDGARKACVAIFQMLGDPHPLTHQYRRVFSMSLY